MVRARMEQVLARVPVQMCRQHIVIQANTARVVVIKPRAAELVRAVVHLILVVPNVVTQQQVADRVTTGPALQPVAVPAGVMPIVAGEVVIAQVSPTATRLVHMDALTVVQEDRVIPPPPRHQHNVLVTPQRGTGILPTFVRNDQIVGRLVHVLRYVIIPFLLVGGLVQVKIQPAQPTVTMPTRGRRGIAILTVRKQNIVRCPVVRK